MTEENKDRLIFFDFETTGLNMFHDKIIEYCFQDAYNPDLSIQSMIDPERKFEFIITKITGIYPDDLFGKPKYTKRLRKLWISLIPKQHVARILSRTMWTDLIPTF